MSKPIALIATLAVLCAQPLFAADEALTIYNQNFAVVRDSVPLDLKQGENPVSFADITAHLEPDSVILRDPTGKINLQVLEQNYRNDPITQSLLLSLFEGKTIDFLVQQTDKADRLTPGKIIRSGYTPHSKEAVRHYGDDFQTEDSYHNSADSAVIEVNGKIQFGLPGQPIFPSLGDDTILKPTLSWILNAEAAGKIDAVLAYITGGMSWEASYNVVVPEDSEPIDLVGWVTMDNRSGKTFTNARIKLMAGDVSKLRYRGADSPRGYAALEERATTTKTAVTEKTFDEYHLYTLPRPVTLHEGETKQVEFIHAAGVKAEKVYVYDGIESEWRTVGNVGSNENLASTNTKVAVMLEFNNSEGNQLGLPLPKGRLRCYRPDGSQLEFTGENDIDHTPKDELVKITTGNAFDLVGERQSADFKAAKNTADEVIVIKLRNHKKEAVEIRVVEHLNRWTKWEISANTVPFSKKNAQAIEFRVQVKPDEEKTVSYKVHYSW